MQNVNGFSMGMCRVCEKERKTKCSEISYAVNHISVMFNSIASIITRFQSFANKPILVGSYLVFHFIDLLIRSAQRAIATATITKIRQQQPNNEKKNSSKCRNHTNTFQMDVLSCLLSQSRWNMYFPFVTILTTVVHFWFQWELSTNNDNYDNRVIRNMSMGEKFYANKSINYACAEGKNEVPHQNSAQCSFI